MRLCVSRVSADNAVFVCIKADNVSAEPSGLSARSDTQRLSASTRASSQAPRKAGLGLQREGPEKSLGAFVGFGFGFELGVAESDGSQPAFALCTCVSATGERTQ